MDGIRIVYDLARWRDESLGLWHDDGHDVAGAEPSLGRHRGFESIPECNRRLAIQTVLQ